MSFPEIDPAHEFEQNSIGTHKFCLDEFSINLSHVPEICQSGLKKIPEKLQLLFILYHLFVFSGNQVWDEPMFIIMHILSCLIKDVLDIGFNS